MDFSETFRYSGPRPVYSPDGKFLATAVEYRLVIRDVENLQVMHLFSCLDKIQHLEWSCDSKYVLCGLFKRAIAQVWSIDEPEWTCKIDEGPAGIAHARWAPDGRHVITVADFHIRMSIWSLVSRSCIYINSPKFTDKGISFTPDGSMMALAERNDCKDSITYFSCTDWTATTKFATPTSDLADLAWSPDGSVLAVWDTNLDYKVLLYDTSGACLSSYKAYGDALGVKQVKWAPTGQFLAVGSFDEMARLLNNVTWESFFDLEHPAKVEGGHNCVVYREVVEVAKGKGAGVKSRYAVAELPAAIKAEKPPLDKANPKLGVGLMSWSADGKFVATRNDNMPTAVWVWDVTCLELTTVLVQAEDVLSMAWSVEGHRLVLCTASTRVFIWSPEGASCVHVPLPSFQAHSIQWSPSGGSFVLTDKDAFCCAFLTSS